jgi:hypothetical protein
MRVDATINEVLLKILLYGPVVLVVVVFVECLVLDVDVELRFGTRELGRLELIPGN